MSHTRASPRVAYNKVRKTTGMKQHQTHSFTSCQFADLFDMVEEAAPAPVSEFTLPEGLLAYFEVQGA